MHRPFGFWESGGALERNESALFNAAVAMTPNWNTLLHLKQYKCIMYTTCIRISIRWGLGNAF